MREFVIENGIVIDDMDSVIDGIRTISGKEISDAETIRKFITEEKATKYYIDKKCTGKMQPDRDTVYLWLDSGYVDHNGNSIMISLLNNNFGGYTGHYFGTMDVLANAIKSYFKKTDEIEIDYIIETMINRGYMLVGSDGHVTWIENPS